MYEFVDDVVRELAELTPGPYLHIGGDEVFEISAEEYVRFVERACEIVRSHGKIPIGWEEIARTRLAPGTIVQHWKDPELAARAAEQGASVIMSPAARTYFDHKYDGTTKLGTQWAGHIGVRDAYDWDPGDALGVEAALWSETLATLADLEVMAFPRLLALAEVAWTPQARPRLGGLSQRGSRPRAASSTRSASTTSARPRSTGPERHRFAKTAVTVSGRASTTEQPRRVPAQPADQRTKREPACGARRELHDRSERKGRGAPRAAADPAAADGPAPGARSCGP